MRFGGPSARGEVLGPGFAFKRARSGSFHQEPGIKRWISIEISVSVYSFYNPGLVSQLLAQRRDDCVDYIAAKVVLEAPDIVQKFYSRDRLSLPCGEIAHYLELLAR